MSFDFSAWSQALHASNKPQADLSAKKCDCSIECTCDSPCCEVDIGVGFITCGAQHCPVHTTPENQGVPGQRTYAEGSLHGVDTVEGKSINGRPHGLGPGEEWHG